MNKDNKLLKFSSLLIAFSVVFLMIVLTSCSTAPKGTPTYQVEQDMLSLKTSELSDSATSLISGSLNDQNQKDMKDLIKRVQDFKYTFTDESIAEDGKTAKVTVNIKTYNFALGYINTWDRLLDENQDNTEFANVFFEEIAKIKSKNFSKDIVINCTKTNDGWETDVANSETLKDAMWGGMMSTVADINDFLVNGEKNE